MGIAEQNEYECEVFEQKAPELLNHLYVKIKNAGVAANLSEEESRLLAKKVTLDVAHDFGGEMIYIPKGILVHLTGRDLKMWQEFNGKNHNELARKYGVSVVWVYKILKKVQQEEIAKRQIDMFK